MKAFTRTLLLATAAALLTQTGRANNDDLVLGFTSGTAANDYVINLGNANTAVGGTSIIDLSSTFSLSTFNTTFTSGTVNMGVVGGSPNDFYMTQSRSGLGTPNTAGSTLGTVSRTALPTLSADANLVLSGSGFTAGQGGQVIVAGNDSSFSSAVETSATSIALQFSDPSSPTSTTAPLYEDLYYAVKPASGRAAFEYEGFFTLDLTGDGGSVLTFTPEAVATPEPSTYALLASGGLLALAFRNRFIRK